MYPNVGDGEENSEYYSNDNEICDLYINGFFKKPVLFYHHPHDMGEEYPQYYTNCDKDKKVIDFSEGEV